MTTYSYKLELDDSECIMLEEALKLMIMHCKEKIKEGKDAPYWAHLDSAKDVLSRLYDNTEQTSGNTFFD